VTAFVLQQQVSETVCPVNRKVFIVDPLQKTLLDYVRVNLLK
jgi:hypothetical protein